MTDIVNAYFRKHYPADWDTAWEQEYCVQSYAKRYKGVAGSRSRIFPEMKCADGFAMSVQGHFGAYSHPRDDFADHYSAVEVMTGADGVPEFSQYGGGSGDDYMIYGYVPVTAVVAVIEKHGGLVEVN